MSYELNGTVVEDACWLHPKKDMQHINLSELEGIIKGVTVALQWNITMLHLFTDSTCVHKRISHSYREGQDTYKGL